MPISDLSTLAKLSAPGPGVTRRAWTDEARAAAEWFSSRCARLGLRFHEDAAGNLFGTWERGQGKPLLVGSHLDSVPNGGRFDGALGVVAGFDAIERLQAAGDEVHRPVTVVSFNDEEGAYSVPMFGSQCFVGVLDLDVWRDRGIPEAMAAYGRDFDSLGDAEAVQDYSGYLELHIEQGPVLDQSGEDIGIVTAIVGALLLAVTLRGQANHSGTTPFELRRDALAAAARVVLDVRAAAERLDGVTVTVGKLDVAPAATNVIPGLAELTVDLRFSEEHAAAEAEAATRRAIEHAGEREGVAVEIRELHRHAVSEAAPDLRAALEEAARQRGAGWRLMRSGAGHDALELSRCLPFGMLFVPSVDGISHNPAERTTDAHCELGVDVLARALELLVAGGRGSEV